MVTKTERLRELLDERGVEWEALPDQQEGDFTITATRWHDGEGGLLTMFISEPHGSTWDFFWLPTPEQAIDATLGKEPDDAAMLRLHDRMNAALFEYERALGNGKADGAITVPFVAEMHHMLEEAATLGSGTCHDLAETPAYRDKTEFKCSECGYEYSAVGGFGCDCGDEPDFNYCPNCGRRVEVDE